LTTTVTLELLLAGLGSGWVPDTVAVLVTVPLRVGVTLIPTKAVRPLIIVPRLQVTLPATWAQEPWEGDERL
jgi:hypothetical protein